MARTACSAPTLIVLPVATINTTGLTVGEYGRAEGLQAKAYYDAFATVYNLTAPLTHTHSPAGAGQIRLRKLL